MKNVIKKITSFAVTLIILGTNIALSNSFEARGGGNSIISNAAQSYNQYDVTPYYAIIRTDEDPTIRTRKAPGGNQASVISKGQYFKVVRHAEAPNELWLKIGDGNNQNQWVNGYYTVKPKTNVTLSGKDNEEKIINFLRDELGLNYAAVCGVLGNMYWEDPELNPDYHQRGGGPGYGICQWEEGGARYTTLTTYYNGSTLEGQLGFMYDELKYSYDYSKIKINGNLQERALIKLQNLKNNDLNDARSATEIFCKEYEGPSIPHIEDRIKITETLYYDSNVSNKYYKTSSNDNPSVLSLPYTGIVVTKTDPYINVREKPTTYNSPIVGRIDYGKSATILEISGNWGRIDDPEHELKGWVCLDYIKTNAIEIFSDVKSDGWYVNAINYVLNNNIMIGKGAAKDSREIIFGTYHTLTRAEFVTSLRNVAGKPTATYENVYIDVPDGKWFTLPVMWAYKNHILMEIEPISSNEFGVSKEITRQEIVKMLYNYAGTIGLLNQYNPNSDANKYASSGFEDSSEISDWAKDAMNWAVTMGVISGKGNSNAPKSEKSLDPQGTSTRSEAAQLMYSFVKKCMY